MLLCSGFSSLHVSELFIFLAVNKFIWLWIVLWRKLLTAGQNIPCKHLLLMQPISSVNCKQSLLISAEICAFQTSDRGGEPFSVHDSAVSCSVWLFILSSAGLVKWVTVFIYGTSFWTSSSWLFFSQGLPCIVHGSYKRPLLTKSEEEAVKIRSCSSWSDCHSSLMPERQGSYSGSWVWLKTWILKDCVLIISGTDFSRGEV